MIPASTSKRKGLLAGAALSAALAVGAGGYLAHAAVATKAPVNAAPVTAPAAPGMGGSFADIIAKVAPAVVSVDVEVKAQPTPALFGGGDDDEDGGDGGLPFSFRQLIPQQPGQQQQQQAPAPKQQGTGSGFFISPDGYIVTNNHVVADAVKITVRTNDDRTFKAHLIGRDEATDLAVIKIDGRDLPYVSFENQAKPRVGDWVIAVGNPFNLGGTATAGIVSALGREQVSGSSYVNYMQIDAPINRGNSGGPTFDVHGRVVGVNSAIFSPSGGSVGIGFDIPADVADTITKQLIAGGKITRGYIGASIQDATADMSESLGLAARKAAIVAETTPGGPSQMGGLMAGDVVLKINGRDVSSAGDLTRQVGLVRPGDTIRLDVWRDGKTRTVEFRSGERPAEKVLASNNGRVGPGADPQARVPESASVLGMRLAARPEGGIAIQNVSPDSDAGDKGLQRGDVILNIGDKPAKSPADLASAVDAARKDGRKNVLLMVQRGGRNIFIPILVDEGQG